MQIMTKIQTLFLVLLLGWVSTAASSALNLGVSIGVAPPPIPVYAQPPCPVDGYMWTPGYWAYDYSDSDYYWVPGVWVAPPSFGLLWTPGYWGCSDGIFAWNAGYWGSQCGFYGGVNYGYGYYGSGFRGGSWSGRHFRYNTAAANVNRDVVHHTFSDRSGIHNGSNRVSFNGPGGTRAAPTAQERTAMNARHTDPTAQQTAQRESAMQDRNQFAKVNQGRPATTAMNSVNGQRFNSEGHAAATTGARQANVVQPGAQSNNPRSNLGDSNFTGERRTTSANTEAQRQSNLHDSSFTGQRGNTASANTERQTEARQPSNLHESSFTGERSTASANAERSAEIQRQSSLRDSSATGERTSAEANARRNSVAERSSATPVQSRHVEEEPRVTHTASSGPAREPSHIASHAPSVSHSATAFHSAPMSHAGPGGGGHSGGSAAHASAHAGAGRQ